ncbi:RNA polymerase sigma-70 domain protein [Candidatus Magnetomorum sp. HK-1]|nr:RNA polymerase sigma-70 domain protein [Candidatus Magnetomorum sp. HK-1]
MMGYKKMSIQRRLNKAEEKRILDEWLINKNGTELFVQYLYLVRSFVCKTFNKMNQAFTEEEIEDLTMDVFEKLLSGALEKYDPKKGLTLSGWIILITQRTTYNYIQKKIKRKSILPIDINGYEQIEFVHDDDLLSELEVYVSLQKCVKKFLTKREKDVFTKFFFEQMSISDIAIYYNKTENSTKKALSTAKKKLKEYENLFCD